MGSSSLRRPVSSKRLAILLYCQEEKTQTTCQNPMYTCHQEDFALTMNLSYRSPRARRCAQPVSLCPAIVVRHEATEVGEAAVH